MIDKYLFSQAQFIINNFKKYYLNKEGLISRNFPPSSYTIFGHLDDIAPFFIYFKETDFLVQQVKKSREFSFDEILAEKNIIYSYKIDEYLGGLFLIWKKTKNQSVKTLLDEAINKILDYFFKDNNLLGTYNIKKRKSGLHYYYWSSGLLETFLEMGDDYPELIKKTEEVVETWLKDDFYLKHNLFPFRNSSNRTINVLNKIIPKFYFAETFLRHHPGMDDKNFLNKAAGEIKSILYNYFLSGQFTQLMKSNSTMIFTLMEMYKLTKEQKYKLAVINWIETVEKKMYKNGTVYGLYYPNGKIKNKDLINTFIFIDVLMDAYFFIEKNASYLELAKEIIDKRLEKKWDNGLCPVNFDEDKAHIDNQVDFSISIRRYAELSGDEFYLKESYDLMEKTLQLYKGDKGFFTNINSSGKPLDTGKTNAIDPKYNGLLLKGIIHMLTIKKNMYDNPKLHDLFKDR
ncbi:MAG: hypothetical protein AAB352_03460 [Patescibacteria group bacterium]